MSQDEMKSNVEQLAKLQTGLETARDELDGINEEERLLEWEQSFFPQLNSMFQMKEPYDKLWNTAWTFHQKHENWTNGRLIITPFLDLIAINIFILYISKLLSTRNITNVLIFHFYIVLASFYQNYRRKG